MTLTLATDNPGAARSPLPGKKGGREHNIRPTRCRRVDLAIAGPTGTVGSSLLHLLDQKAGWLREELSLDLRIVGAINTRGMIWNQDGIPPYRIAGVLPAGPGNTRWSSFANRACGHRDFPLVFLDCTASTFIARQYLSFLRSDIAIVTPNKIANSLEFTYYQELRETGGHNGARYLYETTVGAATPMVQTLRDLRRTGDRIHRVEGVLSGTLSFVFDRINRGDLFSQAVREALQRGYTEPHPASDLSGEDVARKLLILSREAGYRLERGDISVESLVPEQLRHVADPHEYLEQLSVFDEHWSERAGKARREGASLAYLARFDGTTGAVGLACLAHEHPFVRLRPSENAVHYYTDRHTPIPLTIQGIGAGPGPTARGILADVIQAALGLAA